MPDSIGPLVLLATLGTAAEVRAGVAERRAGRDPAALTPDDEAREQLAGVREDLGELLTRLLVHLAVADVEEGHEQAASPRVRTARGFDVLMTLRRLERLLHRAHQHLLSRYAAQDHPDEHADATLESARQLTSEAASLWQRRPDTSAIRPFAERALDFARTLPAG